jgi:hypothetical protein
MKQNIFKQQNSLSFTCENCDDFCRVKGVQTFSHIRELASNEENTSCNFLSCYTKIEVCALFSSVLLEIMV